jgi:hypothetical protein
MSGVFTSVVLTTSSVVKEATNRQKDRESLPRLLQFRDWLGKNLPI